MMTKKEQKEMEALRKELACARAFRFTDPVLHDVLPPTEYSNKLSVGFVFNQYSRSISEACSSSLSHATGTTDRTTTQRSIKMYSSKLLALRALRHALEREFAETLADIDGNIEAEAALPALAEEQPRCGRGSND